MAIFNTFSSRPFQLNEPRGGGIQATEWNPQGSGTGRSNLFATPPTASGGMYQQAPQSAPLRNSSATRQAIMDTISPETVNGNANTAAERINAVYDQRREDIRRKYADFPQMASQEENAMERARANALAEAQLNAKTQGDAERRKTLTSLEGMDENNRRYDEAMARQQQQQDSKSMNDFFSNAYSKNAAKRFQDSGTGKYVGMEGGRENAMRDTFVAGNVTNKDPSKPSAFDVWNLAQNEYWKTPNASTSAAPKMMASGGFSSRPTTQPQASSGPRDEWGDLTDKPWKKTGNMAMNTTRPSGFSNPNVGKSNYVAMGSSRPSSGNYRALGS